MGFGDGFEIPPRGTSGGPSVAWNLGVLCDIDFCIDHIVNLILTSDPLNHHWMVYFVYGPPDCNSKDLFWYELAQCGSDFGGP